MKKMFSLLFCFVCFVCLVLLAGVAFASVGAENDSNGMGAVADINCANGLNCSITNNGLNMMVSSQGTVSLPATTTVLSGANIGVTAIFVPAVAGSYTTDTAANIIAASPWVQIGQTIPIEVSNLSSGNFVLVGGSGVVVATSGTIATTASKTFKALYAASNSFTIY